MSDRVDDAELVARAERGEKEAFEQLVERHLDVVTTAAYSILGNVEAAKDCAQEAFLEATATLSKLRDKTKFGSWIYGISRRKAIYVLRRKKTDDEAMKVKQDESKSAIPAYSPSEQASHNERIESIRRAVNELPEIYREVLILKYIDNRSHEEIAQLLDITLAAVDKRLMRGKDMLREAMRRWKTDE